MVARSRRLDAFGKALAEKYEVKETGRIGFSPGAGKELVILNRTVRVDAENDEMTLEPDARLITQAIEDLKLERANGVDTPRIRRNEMQTAEMES